MEALSTIGQWPVRSAAAAAVAGGGEVLGTHGDVTLPFRLASVTKPLTALACLVAVEEGALDLDAPAGPPGASVRHLLAHAAGLAPDRREQVTPPGTRRIYSNAGFDLLGELVAEQTGMPFGEYLRQAVCLPLGMTATVLDGSPAHAATSTVADLTRVLRELLRPTLLHPDTLREATSVQFPGLPGVLPGYGRQERNDWGLGVEIRDTKSPHWTGRLASPATFGHFGRSGTLLWVDPDACVGCVVLTDRPFGDWAMRAWPPLCDAVLVAAAGSGNGTASGLSPA